MAYGETQAMNGNSMALYQSRPMETVSLSRLIDFSIQRTYHELVVLTELLPRKSDMERKIEIVTFANRTRQLFVRLLGLVKWAGSASKVEKCSTIVSFLDKQSMLFTETADILAKMSRESLVQARLPSFQLPSAVEVLTSGTYTRLPSCIRDKIVPPDPITAEEKKSTLLRLNQIIQQRLVTSQLPQQMRNLKIEYGRVIFHVPFEFELTLTLMGDNSSLPWRVLDLNILVEDKDTGEGKDLVHHLQNTFLQHMIQAKLTENHRSLMEPYEILHSFCLSLQLEVLHAQTVRLSRERLGDFIRIEEYVPGARLCISYWREQAYNDGKGCRLGIEIDSLNPGKLLQAIHKPALKEQETEFANRAIRSDAFSIEKLLIYTTHERAKEILLGLRDKFQNSTFGRQLTYEIAGSPPALCIAYLQPCMDSEKLILSVDALTGQIMVHVPQFDQCPFVDELQVCVKKDINRMFDLIQQLRVWVMKERYKKTADYLGVQIIESLPIVNASNHAQLQNDPKSRLFMHFVRHPQHYLLVQFDSKDPQKQTYYVMLLESCNDTDNLASADLEIPSRSLLTLTSIFELNVNCILKQQPTKSTEIERFIGHKRRKIDLNSTQIKRSRFGSYFISEFAYIVSFCEDKLTYGVLCKALQDRSICYLTCSPSDLGCHYVEMLQLPTPDSATRLLHKELLSCSIRLQSRTRLWQVCLRFSNQNLPSILFKNDNFKQLVMLTFDYSAGQSSQLQQILNNFIDDWYSFAKLYECVHSFSKYKNLNSLLLSSEIRQFTYKQLIISYGPGRNYTVTLQWKTSEKRFLLNFGVAATQNGNTNPHIIVATQLQHEFNQNCSIATLVQVLNRTFQGLSTIQHLVSIPLFGAIANRPYMAAQSFCLIPQSSTHIRIVYRNIYCIDVMIQSDGLIAIRDGAYSLFDNQKALEELSIIGSLKTFLTRFVDKTLQHTRRHSQNEDDNPPSPITQMDSMDPSGNSSGVGSVYSLSKSNINSPLPAMGDHNISQPGMLSNQLRGGGLHTSNPNTPASPHTSILSQTGYVPSPGHPEPSPGNMFPVNSPISSIHAPSPSSLHPQQSPAPPNSNSSNFNLSMPSPGASGWPNSPSLSRPSPSRPVQSPAQSSLSNQTSSGQPILQQPHMSRVMPAKYWAASVPTLLTHAAFEAMCKPNAQVEPSNMPGNSVNASLSQLERFLFCTFIRRNLNRYILQDDFFTSIISEAGVTQFKNENLQFKISLHPVTMQSLQVKIQPLNDSKVQWTSEEIEILERFLETKIVCASFRSPSFLSFARMMNVPHKTLKSCIQLMRIELFPDRNLKWIFNWCLTIPPSNMTMLAPGMTGFVITKSASIIFFIKLTRNTYNNIGGDAQSIVVPLVYEMGRFTLSILPREATSGGPVYQHINAILARCNEYSSSHPGEYCFSNHILEIMRNDLMPS